MEKQDKKKGPGAVETLFATAGKFVATVCSAIVGFIKGLVKKNPKLAIPLLIAAAVLIVSIAAVFTENAITTKTKLTALGFKDIGEYATQAAYYTSVHAESDDVELWGWKVPFTHSEMVFSYDGVIKAGFDFSKIEVSVNDVTKSVKIVFPEVIIIANDIDEDSLEIYDEDKNIFTPFEIENFGNALIELKEEALEKSVANGLFDNARKNGEVTMQVFLSSLYNPAEYTFVFRHAEPSELERQMTAEVNDIMEITGEEAIEEAQE